MGKLILASGSPRRRSLLEQAEVDFEVVVTAADEGFPSHLSPEEAAVHVARSKSGAVLELLAGREEMPSVRVLSADTMVVLDGSVIGKPSDREEAIGILRKLSGRTHHVVTGVCIRQDDRTVCFSETTEVEFIPLTEEAIAHYVDRYCPYDKAGSYAIQEWIGLVGVRSIKGDYYNVMGLPVCRVLEALGRFPEI